MAFRSIWMKSSSKSPRERKSCLISVRLKSRSTAWHTSIFWIPFPKIRSTILYDVIGNRQKYTRKSSGKCSNYTLQKITKRILISIYMKTKNIIQRLCLFLLVLVLAAPAWATNYGREGYEIFRSRELGKHQTVTTLRKGKVEITFSQTTTSILPRRTTGRSSANSSATGIAISTPR